MNNVAFRPGTTLGREDQPRIGLRKAIPGKASLRRPKSQTFVSVSVRSLAFLEYFAPFGHSVRLQVF